MNKQWFIFSCEANRLVLDFHHFFYLLLYDRVLHSFRAMRANVEIFVPVVDYRIRSIFSQRWPESHQYAMVIARPESWYTKLNILKYCRKWNCTVLYLVQCLTQFSLSCSTSYMFVGSNEPTLKFLCNKTTQGPCCFWTYGLNCPDKHCERRSDRHHWLVISTEWYS